MLCYVVISSGIVFMLQHSDQLIFWNKRKRRLSGLVFVSIFFTSIASVSIIFSYTSLYHLDRDTWWLLC